jgi:hypothetical protein
MSKAKQHRRRRLGFLAVLGLLVIVGALLASGSGGSQSARRTPARTAGAPSGHATTTVAVKSTPLPPPPPLLVRPTTHATTAWSTVAEVHGHPAAWVSQRGGVTLMRFDQSLLRLDLHAGSSDGGVSGWVYGDQIAPSEIHHVVAGFNGGFKLTYTDVGFLMGGHVAVPLHSGLASIVTYTNGRTDIGAWHEGAPSGGNPVFSVLQNQHLLVDRGRAATDTSCIQCWGTTISGLTSVARSALGISAAGQLVWAAGEQLLPDELAQALISAGAVRAIELDINPDWVAGYLYVHHAEGPAGVPVVPGQLGIAGRLLEPYSRDFLVLVAR